MRYKLKPRLNRDVEIGDHRVIYKFLWIPVCVDEEWRWLESARIEQVFAYSLVPFCSWINIEWKDFSSEKVN